MRAKPLRRTRSRPWVAASFAWAIACLPLPRTSHAGYLNFFGNPGKSHFDLCGASALLAAEQDPAALRARIEQLDAAERILIQIRIGRPWDEISNQLNEAPIQPYKSSQLREIARKQISSPEQWPVSMRESIIRDRVGSEIWTPQTLQELESDAWIVKQLNLKIELMNTGFFSGDSKHYEFRFRKAAPNEAHVPSPLVSSPAYLSVSGPLAQMFLEALRGDLIKKRGKPENHPTDRAWVAEIDSH
jgi:hypothetical protein